MSTVYIMVGPPGAGKSTYCREVLTKKYPEALYISTDAELNKYKDLRRPEAWEIIYKQCADAINKGIDLIYDAPNIIPTARAKFKTKLTMYGADISKVNFVAYFMNIDTLECVSRVNMRNITKEQKNVSLNVVMEYATSLVKPTLDEGFSEIIEVNSDWKLKENNYAK